MCEEFACGKREVRPEWRKKEYFVVFENQFSCAAAADGPIKVNIPAGDIFSFALIITPHQVKKIKKIHTFFSNRFA